MQLTSKYFGKINTSKPKEWYEITLQLNSKNVDVAITILSKESVDATAIKKIDAYLDNFRRTEQTIRQLFVNDYHNNGETKNYIHFIKKDLEPQEIVTLTKSEKAKMPIDEKLLHSLYLYQIVFCPEKTDTMFAVLDYTINKELTNEILVLKCYKNNDIRITIES